LNYLPKDGQGKLKSANCQSYLGLWITSAYPQSFV